MELADAEEHLKLACFGLRFSCRAAQGHDASVPAARDGMEAHMEALTKLKGELPPEFWETLNPKPYTTPIYPPIFGKP